MAIGPRVSETIRTKMAKLRQTLGLAHSPKDAKRLNANLAERKKALKRARLAARPKSKVA
ncbi:MAG: hypothetical protein QGI60_02120 [archaeon]|jgi:hypothetical protein|nr:hypothetical protein [archaeon]